MKKFHVLLIAAFLMLGLSTTNAHALLKKNFFRLKNAEVLAVNQQANTITVKDSQTGAHHEVILKSSNAQNFKVGQVINTLIFQQKSGASIATTIRP